MIRFFDERSMIQRARRSRTPDGALYKLDDEMRHDECLERVSRRESQSAAGRQRRDRGRDAERHAAEMCERGPEDARAS